MKKLLCVLVLVVSLSYAGIDVLVAFCDYPSLEAVANIADTNYDSVVFMDVSPNGRGSTPDVATLSMYDVVLTWSGFPYDDSITMGNNLADYVDGGGKVIIATFALCSASYGLSGRIMDDAAYCPLTPASLDYTYTQLGSYDSHPIMDGVSSITGMHFWSLSDLEADAIWIADLASSYDMVALNDAETVAAVNLYPGDFLEWSGDGWVLFNNTIKYLGGYQENLVGVTWAQIKAGF